MLKNVPISLSELFIKLSLKLCYSKQHLVATITKLEAWADLPRQVFKMRVIKPQNA